MRHVQPEPHHDGHGSDQDGGDDAAVGHELPFNSLGQRRNPEGHSAKQVCKHTAEPPLGLLRSQIGVGSAVDRDHEFP